MTQGRLNRGDLNPGKVDEGRDPFERGLDGLQSGAPMVQPPPPLSASDFPFLTWDEEPQLLACFDRAKEPKPTGFPPMETLYSRLDELNSRSGEEANTLSPVFAGTTSSSSAPKQSAHDLEWFEERFAELKTILSHREADNVEIVSIKEKLEQIIERVDRLSTQLPGEKTMSAVETQLSALARSLEATRVQSASDANRIARAAQEILAATEKAEDARVDFEHAVTHTVGKLEETVIARIADPTKVNANGLGDDKDSGRLQRMENELRALNSVSRETCDRTTAALERVHETLRLFLEKGHAEAALAAKKRAGVHTPITSNAPAYTIGDDFGSEPERKPRLDTITLRKPPPPDPNLFEALKEASEKLAASKVSGFAKRNPEEAPSSAGRKSIHHFSDEERTFHLIGIGIVATVLLIISGVMLYRHFHHEAAGLTPSRVSVLPDNQAPRMATTEPFDLTIQGGAPKTGETKPIKPDPSLFTSADQNHAPPPATEPAREDIQALTEAASRGDREAQFRVASRFLNATTMQQGDPAAAARWLTKAAEQGHVESEFVLASLYEHGMGVPKNDAIARDLYRKAASAGHLRAMYNLGVMLCAEDEPQFYQEAAAWFANAAMAKLTDAQFNLAVLYQRGLGLQQNNQKAYFWYEVAAIAGDKEAARQVERLKRQLPESETQAIEEQAGSWHSSVEQHPHFTSPAKS